MEKEVLKSLLLPKILHWIDQQRDQLLPRGRCLSAKEKSILSGYFAEETLDSVRVIMVDRITNPEFYQELKAQGLPLPLDLTQAQGLALMDSIVLREDPYQDHLPTIFHELVHLVQMEFLGKERMVELYLSSLLTGGYLRVPFEQQAYRLTARFLGGERFSVRQMVEQECGCFL